MAKRRIRKKLIMRMLDMGISNQDMAEYIDIKPTRMSEYRHGYRKKLSVEEINKMCIYLNSYIGEILYAEDIHTYFEDMKKGK